MGRKPGDIILIKCSMLGNVWKLALVPKVIMLHKCIVVECVRLIFRVPKPNGENGTLMDSSYLSVCPSV